MCRTRRKWLVLVEALHELPRYHSQTSCGGWHLSGLSRKQVWTSKIHTVVDGGSRVHWNLVIWELIILLVSDAEFWQLSQLCFLSQLVGVFVTYFLFRHLMDELRYLVSHHASVGLSDFKLFPLLSARGLCSHAAAVTSRSRIGSFVGTPKWHLIFPLLTSYHEWKVRFVCHKYTTWDPWFSLLKDIVLWIFVAI
jgi:hypothetical protein